MSTERSYRDGETRGRADSFRLGAHDFMRLARDKTDRYPFRDWVASKENEDARVGKAWTEAVRHFVQDAAVRGVRNHSPSIG